MKLLDLISLPNEPALEKWARLFRFTAADPILHELFQKKEAVSLFDIGCGQDILYYRYLLRTFPEAKRKLRYHGIDPLLKTYRKSKNVWLYKDIFEHKARNNDRKQADVVTMFALLEHVDNPIQLLRFANELLASGGKLILTTPTPVAKFPLETLSSALGVISTREIEEHKRYPTKESIDSMWKTISKRPMSHRYFELGLNNLAVFSKNQPNTVDDSSYSLSEDLQIFWRALLKIRQ